MEDVKKLAIEKLLVLSIETESDSQLDFFVTQAQERLKNLLNTDTLPQDTQRLLSNMTVGLFLENKLIKEGEYNGNLKSIREGDISMSYDGGSSLWEIARELAHPNDFELSPYRRLIW